MIPEKDVKTAATVATAISVVALLASKVQNPNAVDSNPAMEHKVASAFMKKLNKYVANK